MAVGTEQQGAIEVAEDDLERVRALYESGDFLEAYQVAQLVGPLDRWSGAGARVMAGRLAWILGAGRLAKAMHLRAWRDEPEHPHACYYASRTILIQRGPLDCWEFLKRVGPLPEAEVDVRSDWLATHAIALGGLRDFDAAWPFLKDAERLAPERAWILVERSGLLAMEDRYDEALDAAREALANRPWYRPAVEATAGLLQLLDREEEAEALLAEASAHFASGTIVAHLAALYYEAGRYAEARDALDRFEILSPLMDAPTRRWLAGRRSDVAFALGDRTAAAAFAREAGDPFFLAIAERLENPGPDARRRRLAVGFVRQHHQTCAPATLAAIARYWNKPADHLEVASAICYDGTPDHRERSWAESNGWVAREFTVTWDAAVSLIDRNVPFTLTTVATQSAHLQAVIGYDARRGTLLIRDPGSPHEQEALAEGLLRSHRSVGPRGMALVPVEHASRLQDLALPEASLYDHLYAGQVALREHDRDGAAAAFGMLWSEAPGHRLAHHARRILASYDADTPAMLAAVEALRADFPEDVNLQLAQLAYLRDLGRRDDRLAIYRQACAGRSPDPILRRQYAQELLADARDHRCVARLARAALRSRQGDAPAVWILATVAWDARRHAEALELYRYAFCLDDKDEGLAHAYFAAARALHREDEPLHLLAGRYRRLGLRSALPARTLHSALAEIDRTAEAADVLAEALRLRPNDGELLLYAAEADATIGEFARAAQGLEAARGHCRHGDWLRAAARLASIRGDQAAALGFWREVVAAEPAALDANRAIARLLAETDGRAAALEHLWSACARSPHNYSLRKALIEWLRDEGPGASEAAIRRLLDSHPADAWAHRELAISLSDQGKHAEAETELFVAAQLEPTSTTEASVRGHVLAQAGRVAEAREAFREAIRRGVDNESAIDGLIQAAGSQAERLDDLRFVAAELERQVIFGEGLLAFARRARGTLGPDGLLAILTAALEARPDLWHAWSALIREQIEQEKLDAAEELARRAVDRFPLLPRLWVDLASVCRVRGDLEGECTAIRRALRISPGYGTAARQLALALERDSKYEESRLVLERAIAHAPLDPANHGFLADTLWHLGDKDAAAARIAQAVRVDPGYQWAWETFDTWSTELGRPGAAAELARELTQTRAGDARGWLALARTLDGPGALDERLAALDRAAALEPRDFDPYDLKAELLAEAGRFDEAEAACHPPAFGDYAPIPLRGRAAWVVASRGDIPGALARIRPLLADNPDYAWGWAQCTEWSREAESKEEYLKAAEISARLHPDHAVSLGYLGEARMRNGDRAGARASFERAVALMPTYRFGTLNLFDLELKENDLEAAGKTLVTMKNAGEVDGYVMAREVQWCAARRDRDAALEALNRLCTTRDLESEWPVRAAADAMTKAGWGRFVDEAYAKALAQPETPPAVGTVWAERWGTRRDWRQARQLGALLKTGSAAAKFALAEYVKALGQARAGVRLALCIRRHRIVLRSHPRAWGTVGYALMNVCRYRAAVNWLADWQRREDVEPWMLSNLALALRALGRRGEANRVNRHAVSLPSGTSTAHHQLWLALDELLDGVSGDMAMHLDAIDTADFDATNKYLHRLAQILRDVATADGDAVRSAARGARKALLGLNRTTTIPPEDYPAVLDAARRASRQLTLNERPGIRIVAKLMLWITPPRRGPFA